MNILLLASHSIAEYDDIRMFTDLGYDVFSPGGYQNPQEPGEGLRPGIPDAPVHHDLIEACEEVRRKYGEPGQWIDWAKAHVPDDVLDWADVLIVHHFPDRWIGVQWERIKGKRVIWRTCGQSNPELEAFMGHFRRKGMQIVRYSPKEANLPNYAGSDALIRFGKYPADYGPWTGEDALVANVTQHLVQRGEACGYPFWQAATEGLPTKPAGPGSEEIGGLGSLSFDDMRDYLRRCRVYLYMGTRPASYTLGLMEAMLTGIPVVSIGPRAFGPGWVGDVFDLDVTGRIVHDTPESARLDLQQCLTDMDWAQLWGDHARQRAIDLFDVATVGPQWRTFLEGTGATRDTGRQASDVTPAQPASADAV